MRTWNPDRLHDLLAGSIPADEVRFLAEVTSTNDALREVDARVLIADLQTGGRGRRGRSWYSPAGRGLYVSIRFEVTAPPAEVPRWTLAVAEATAAACEAHTGVAVRLKWPNDLLVDGRKLGGVLAELRSADLIVGLGLNLDHGAADFPPELANRATSLRIATGARMDREAITAAILLRIDSVARELSAGGWPAIRSRFTGRAPAVSGARVRIDPGGDASAYEGTTRGLDDHGALRVVTDGGDIVTVYAAESVTPLSE